MGIYVVFPEEREPGDLLSPLDNLEEKGEGLHIHKKAFLHFSNSMLSERLKLISIVRKENPEIYEMLKGRKLTREEIARLSTANHFNAFINVMYSWSEIVTTIFMLHDAHEYLGTLPDAKKHTVSRYFRYHMSNHLNEFFMLRERMRSLIEMTHKLYRKDTRFHKFNKHFLALKSVPEDNFKEIKLERNIHVHEKRFTDDMIEALEDLEFDLEQNINDPEVVYPLYLQGIEIYKQYALERTDGINTEVRSMVDLFFGILERFLFSDQGVFIPPQESLKGKR